MQFKKKILVLQQVTVYSARLPLDQVVISVCGVQNSVASSEFAHRPLMDKPHQVKTHNVVEGYFSRACFTF